MPSGTSRIERMKAVIRPVRSLPCVQWTSTGKLSGSANSLRAWVWQVLVIWGRIVCGRCEVEYVEVETDEQECYYLMG
ncbi:hypothetical protein BC937DRAFT_86781 [Endogone sp. FLAS-F59071]|nr:hypothetical protein BC937DRAFT_86781 [Endogone sp. FLAS-F59071]|eukprot:RUS19876.1 hypothetical protein BC937DRAFT_86781 [Endogone sp. FLAS-F59071]